MEVTAGCDVLGFAGSIAGIGFPYLAFYIALYYSIKDVIYS